MKRLAEDTPVLKQVAVRKQPRLLSQSLPAIPPDRHSAVPMRLTDLSEKPHAADSYLPPDAVVPAKGIDKDFSTGYEQGRESGFEAGRVDGNKHGYEEGLHLGRQEAQRQWDAKCAELLVQQKKLAQLHAAVSAELERWCTESEAELVAIAHAAVLKILGKAIGEEHGVTGVVRQALAQAREAIQLRVHPDDLAVLRQQFQSDQVGHAIELVADDAVQAGGCLIRTSAGTLDAQLESQLRMFAGLLLEVYAQRREGA